MLLLFSVLRSVSSTAEHPFPIDTWTHSTNAYMQLVYVQTWPLLFIFQCLFSLDPLWSLPFSGLIPSQTNTSIFSPLLLGKPLLFPRMSQVYITNGVTEALLVLWDSFPPKGPVLPLKVSHLLLASSWTICDPPMSHGTICNFYQLLALLFAMFSLFSCHTKQFLIICYVRYTSGQGLGICL